MKKRILIIVLLLTNIIKAQIIDGWNINNAPGEVNNAYYKDLTNFRDQFVGTWKYTNPNTNTTLILTFQKRDQIQSLEGNISFTQDILVGDYQYIENGIEKVNTLANINTNFGNNLNDCYNHMLTSIWLCSPQIHPQCTECQPNEFRISLTFNEPNFDGLGMTSTDFFVRAFTENGVQKLKIWFISTSNMVRMNPDGTKTYPPSFKLPYGEYVLTKQY